MLGHIHLLGMSPRSCHGAPVAPRRRPSAVDWRPRCRIGPTNVRLRAALSSRRISPCQTEKSRALIATGRIDAVEMIACEPRYLEAWYRYLNAGYRLPIVGGTDKMTSDVAVGQIRTYAESRAKGDYQGWLDAIRRGRCYATSGPLLDLAVDGARSGDLHEAAPGDRLCLRAEALSIFPLERLDLLVDGEVVATRSATGSEQLTLEAEWTVDRPIWVAARVFAGPEMRLHHDIWNRPIMAHSSPVYVGTSAGTYRKTDVRTLRHMRRLCEAIRLHLSHRAVTAWPGAARQASRTGGSPRLSPATHRRGAGGDRRPLAGPGHLLPRQRSGDNIMKTLTVQRIDASLAQPSSPRQATISSSRPTGRRPSTAVSRRGAVPSADTGQGSRVPWLSTPGPTARSAS